MYLSLGKNTSVRLSEIVAVFDLDTSSYSQLTREYLSRAEKAGLTVNLSDDLPKSLVLCEEGGESRAYLCSLAPATLQKRAESGQ